MRALQVDFICVKPFSRNPDSLLQNSAAKPAAALHGDHPADGHMLTLRAAVQDSQIRFDPALVFQPEMHRILIQIVRIKIRTVLLHHKDRGAKSEDGVHLIRCQLVKMFDLQGHEYVPS